MRNRFLTTWLAFHNIYTEDRTIRRKRQPKPTPQSADEALKLINKAEAKRQRKNKARLALGAGGK